MGKSTFLKLLIGQLEPVGDSVTKRLQTKLIALLSELYFGFGFLCGQIRKNKAMSNENCEIAGKELNTTFVVHFTALIIIKK